MKREQLSVIFICYSYTKHVKGQRVKLNVFPHSVRKCCVLFTLLCKFTFFLQIQLVAKPQRLCTSFNVTLSHLLMSHCHIVTFTMSHCQHVKSEQVKLEVFASFSAGTSQYGREKSKISTFSFFWLFLRSFFFRNVFQ